MNHLQHRCLLLFVAARYLKAMGSSNGKVATIGYCSGDASRSWPRAASTLDAAVDCYGAFVVAGPPEGSPLKAGPVAHAGRAPLVPVARAVRGRGPEPLSRSRRPSSRRSSRAHHKTFEFHTFEGAGHAFFATNRPNYRPEAAARGMEQIWDFFGRHLSA